MTSSSQLSDVLHVLLHMAEIDGPSTSEALAAAMGSHPVVLRRLMGGLRQSGMVESAKGHGGGWVLCCPLARITLRDVHEALGAPALVSLGFRETHPACLVAQVVNDSLGAAVQDAEARLLRSLDGVTLATLSEAFHQRRLAQGHAPHRLHEHHTP